MILRVMGGLALKGLAVGAAWGAFVAGIVQGFLWGIWCVIFDSCSLGAPLVLPFYFALFGAVIGAAYGSGIGILAGGVAAIQLFVDEKWLCSRNFAVLMAFEVAVPCAIFLPETLWGVADENGGGLMFSAPWDAVYQLFIFKITPTVLAGYFTWSYLRRAHITATEIPDRVSARAAANPHGSANHARAEWS